MTDCSVCGKSFDNERDYENHIEQAHEAMNATYSEAFCKANEGNNYRCETCGFNTNNEEEAKTHKNNNDDHSISIHGAGEEIEQHQDKPMQTHDEWMKDLQGLKDEYSKEENEHPRINISYGYGKDAKKLDSLDDLKAEEDGGADDPLKKVADLAESWTRLDTERRAKLFESLGINQGSAYTLANLDWYNLSPQLKKDASEAYAKEEDELVIDNDEDLYALHQGLMDKPIKDDDKEINEAYRDIYNIEKNHLSPDYKKKAIECSRCNLKFDSNENRDIHFNEVHATEQEYNLPEECPFCQDLIKEPETLDFHLEKEHGVHVPSQYTQTGITGAMADTDFDKLENDFYAEAKEGWYVLTVGDDLWHYDTREEAENAVKNFPAGTYKIGEESKATEAKWECLDCDSEFDDAGKHQEETGHHNIARKRSDEGTSDYEVDVDEYLKTGEPTQKLPTDKRVNEGQGGTYGRSSFMLNPEHTDVTQCIICGRTASDHSNPNTDYRGLHGTSPPTDHYFLGGDAGGSDDKYDFESYAKEDDMDDLQYRQQFGHDWWDKKARKERLKREGKAEESDGWSECENCNFIGTNNEDTKKHEQETGHKTNKYSFQPVIPTFLESKATEEDMGFTRKCFDWEGFEIDCETKERIGQGYSQSKAYQKFLNESNAMERGQPNMEECPTCEKLINIDKLEDHRKKEHGE